MRLLMLGDTHGNTAWIRHAVDRAVKNNCEKIVQLGDFGFWAHTDEGVRFLRKTSEVVTQAGLELYWVDGNHENHDLLWEVVRDARQNVGVSAPLPRWDALGFIEHELNVFYCPRGLSWVWDGVKFLSLGGAYSIDAEYRIAGHSWWPGELTTDVDVNRAIAQGKVDVMLCHDAPRGVTPWDEFTERDRKANRWPESAANRDRIRDACDYVTPKVLFHGHYHLRHEETITVGDPPQAMIVQGLGCDGDKDGSTYVFDTASIKRVKTE